MKAFSGDPDLPIQELLTIVGSEALRGASGSSAGNLNFALPHFAALLVRLSRDAERRSARIEKLTWAMTFLTLVLAILTAMLIIH